MVLIIPVAHKFGRNIRNWHISLILARQIRVGNVRKRVGQYFPQCFRRDHFVDAQLKLDGKTAM